MGNRDDRGIGNGVVQLVHLCGVSFPFARRSVRTAMSPAAGDSPASSGLSPNLTVPSRSGAFMLSTKASPRFPSAHSATRRSWLALMVSPLGDFELMLSDVRGSRCV